MGYKVGGLAAELADAIGGDSKQAASGLTWRIAEGVIGELFNEDGKPKLSQEEALSEVRKGLDNAPWT